MESRRNGPQLSSRHDDDDDEADSEGRSAAASQPPDAARRLHGVFLYSTMQSTTSAGDLIGYADGRSFDDRIFHSFTQTAATYTVRVCTHSLLQGPTGHGKLEKVGI